MFGTVLEMGKYALQYIIFDKTLTQDKDKSSVKKKTDDQRLAARCVTAACCSMFERLVLGKLAHWFQGTPASEILQKTNN